MKKSLIFIIFTITLLTFTATAAIQNGGFEFGTLTGWTKTGTAWDDSPETTNYWPGQQVGFNCEGTYFALSRRTPPSAPDAESATGSLSSTSFSISENHVLSFLICGYSTHFAPLIYNYVSIKRVSDNTEVERIYTPEGNSMSKATFVPTAELYDVDLYIEIVDNCTSGAYAWLGVDAFKIEEFIPPHPRNWDFETGTYTNWTAISGTAFGKPTTKPFATLTVWQGLYYANSAFPDGTTPNEPAVGVMRSDTFTFPANNALSFLIGGASIHWGYTNTYITLNLASDNTELARILTPENPVMVRKSFDVPDAYGKEVYIEVVDNGTETGWAWIAVDDFEFIDLGQLNFDFEEGYIGWDVIGTAWGSAPVTTNWIPVHFANNPIHGEYYANSMVGGESATGTLRSTTFTYPQDGYVKFLVGGYSKHWDSVVYNYVVLKDAATHAEYGKVYAPDQNDVTEKSITNSSANNKEVYIEIVDNCTSGGFAWIAVDYFQVKTPIPEPVTGVEATDGSTNDRIIVSWYFDGEADKYIVYRNTADDTNTATDISGELGDVTQFDDETALYNTNYYYWVKAGNSYGWSELSDYDIGFRTDSTGPNKPENISPADGTEPDFPISLTASPYSDLDGWSFITSEWHISSSATFSPRKRIRASSVNKISPSSGNLYSGINYWRVRYKNDKNQWSDWSDSTIFIVNRDTDSPFYFYDTFNNVSGAGDVNQKPNTSGRQLGIVAPIDYVFEGATEIGISAENPNQLTLLGVEASCSPNFSFQEYNNFKIEFDITPNAAGSAFSFGKIEKNAKPDSVGGMGFVFYGNGNYDVYSSDSKLGTFNNEAVNKTSFHITIKVLTIDFDNSTAQIAMFADGQPLILQTEEFVQPFRTNHYNFVYEKSNGFDYNYVTFYNFSGSTIFDNFQIQNTPSDNLNVYKWTDDANSRINSDFNYTHAVNFNTENDVDINSVTFTGTGTSPVYGLNPVVQPGGTVYQRFVANDTASVIGDTWELIAADGLFETDSDWEAPPYYVAADGDKLLEHFLFSSADGIQIKLDGLTPGTSNIFAMHFRGWWGAGFEYQIAANDSGALALAPVELYGAGTGTVFEYRYKVPENGKLDFTLSNCGLPMYSFSNFKLTNEILPKLESLDLIDFGEVVAGQTITFKLPIFNFGAGTVSGIVTGADAQFELLSGKNYSAKSESPDFLNISFTPPFEEQYSNTVYLTGTGGNLQIELKGLGVPEPISVIGYLLFVIGIFIFRKKK